MRNERNDLNFIISNNKFLDDIYYTNSLFFLCLSVVLTINNTTRKKGKNFRCIFIGVVAVQTIVKQCYEDFTNVEKTCVVIPFSNSFQPL